MKFLATFWVLLHKFTSKIFTVGKILDTKDTFELVLQDSEPLARYIYFSNHLYAPNDKGDIKPKLNAFMPSKNGETSIFRTIGLSSVQLMDLGLLYGRKDRELKGAAIFSSDVIEIINKENRTNVKIHPDNNPERHANIISWPEEKSEQKAIAREIAKLSNYIAT